MNQDNLAKLLEWLLSERLRSPSGVFATAAPRRVRRLLTCILEARRANTGDACGLPLDDGVMTRIQGIPPSVRDALRRYYVFGEAGDTIARSMELSLPEFRRLRVGARNFILGRRPPSKNLPHGPEYRVQ